jgi:hypothetical protein
MTPFGGKIIIILIIAVLYVVMKMMFKNTLKGERSVPYLLFIIFTPFIAYASAIILLYFVKVVYYWYE